MSKDDLDLTFEALKRASLDTVLTHVAISVDRDVEDLIDVLSQAQAYESKSLFHDYYKANGWTLKEIILECKKRRNR